MAVLFTDSQLVRLTFFLIVAAVSSFVAFGARSSGGHVLETEARTCWEKTKRKVPSCISNGTLQSDVAVDTFRSELRQCCRAVRHECPDNSGAYPRQCEDCILRHGCYYPSLLSSCAARRSREPDAVAADSVSNHRASWRQNAFHEASAPRNCFAEVREMSQTLFAGTEPSPMVIEWNRNEIYSCCASVWNSCPMDPLQCKACLVEARCFSAHLNSKCEHEEEKHSILRSWFARPACTLARMIMRKLKSILPDASPKPILDTGNIAALPAAKAIGDKVARGENPLIDSSRNVPSLHSVLEKVPVVLSSVFVDVKVLIGALGVVTNFATLVEKQCDGKSYCTSLPNLVNFLLASCGFATIIGGLFHASIVVHLAKFLGGRIAFVEGTPALTAIFMRHFFEHMCTFARNSAEAVGTFLKAVFNEKSDRGLAATAFGKELHEQVSVMTKHLHIESRQLMAAIWRSGKWLVTEAVPKLVYWLADMLAYCGYGIRSYILGLQSRE
eukprot:TRINITY_DN14415_c0_g1_i3.p1 TRINITY_DN14415_c0_g1~~TRINITY_DN14415_c0_g1_i3.p1  ORF type:complete len:500 (-),score=48.91 TRINITY_DN14415_c0_g1_i3:138-1637(-)